MVQVEKATLGGALILQMLFQGKGLSSSTTKIRIKNIPSKNNFSHEYQSF
jgi:hypothetical protein